MSDGIHDQLFFAVRLASPENYCASTDPVPFIADDILQHSDDERLVVIGRPISSI